MGVVLEVAERNSSGGFPAGEEVFLKVTMDGSGYLFSKHGAFVAGQGQYQFDPVLLGPQGNPLQAIAGQVIRRVTGENMSLMKTISQGQSITYYACNGQHVVVINLDQGETIYVESEDLLAFNDSCGYSTHFLATGVMSQKGLFTSAITGQKQGAQAAILVDGNPLILQTPCRVDPDAMVAFTGADPSVHFDMSLKMLLGKTSGETYMLDYKQSGGIVIIQPVERSGGIKLCIDDANGNSTKNFQQGNQSFNQSVSNLSDTASSASSALSGLSDGLTSGSSSSGLGGLGNVLGGLFK